MPDKTPTAAFPAPLSHMELRDWFAGQVAPSFVSAALSVDGGTPHVNVEDVSADAYAMADALLRERAK